MTPFERANHQLKEFCQNKEQRVYALKGPWGAGKSYLVREFLKTHKRDLPACVSYVSVFGLRSIQEVQERINGCLEYTNAAAKLIGKIGRGAVSTVSTATTSVPHLNVKVPDFSNSAFWFIAKQYGVLIILDDLERAPDLKISQLLGLTSSIAENSNARVLLVFNDEKLEGENKADYYDLREKVLDGELAFRPAVRDLVVEYLGDETLTDIVVFCLEKRGGSNIRMIRRIKTALTDFRKAMNGTGIPFERVDLEAVARLTWHFNYAPNPLTEDDKIALLWGEFGPPSRVENEETENLSAHLARSVGMVANTFDPLILKYLTEGYYSEEDLAEFAASDEKRRREQTLELEAAQVVGLFNDNFRATEDQLLEAVESLLERSCHLFTAQSLHRFTWLLSVHGRNEQAQIWWQKYLDAVLPTADEETCRRLLESFHAPEHAEQINARLAALRPQISIQDFIAQSVKNRSYVPADAERFCALPDSFYREWFETAEDDLFGPISSFLRFSGSSSKESAAGRLHDKIAKVLVALAGENRINQNRVQSCFKLSPDDSPTQSLVVDPSSTNPTGSEDSSPARPPV